MDELSSSKSSTDTSVCVAEGGKDNRTVRKVSCNKTACQSLRRWCFSNRLAAGVTEPSQFPRYQGMKAAEIYGLLTDVWVPVQTHGICLPNQDTRKRPSVRGMVVVDEEIDDENHCLNRS